MRPVSLSFGLSSETIDMNYPRPLFKWTKFCSWGFAVVGKVFAMLILNARTHMKLSMVAHCCAPGVPTRGCEAERPGVCSSLWQKVPCHKQTGKGELKHPRLSSDHHSHVDTHIKEALIL